ncbi:MAG TPA: M14 family zinc carboxypeptidase, partial [Clostridia bacterium]|nr:M14 family zinc carboxypeptidase [Clostridia bacterium]
MDRFFDETRPMGYDELYCVTQKLKKEYDFLQSFSIGKSVLGRSIITYLLGKGRPCILYVGGHHALEYITSMLLVRLTEDLCRCYRSGENLGGFDIHSILSACSVYIIPMLNPDGVEI